MLDEILAREDVTTLLNDICTSARYFDKVSTSSMGYKIYSQQEQILFLVYDAFYKYKIIIDDMDFFDDFMIQLDKLIKKIDNFSDISYGINRIIGRVCAFKLGDVEIESDAMKNIVLRHIYEKYYEDGYLIHGFSATYYNHIKENGFIIDEYNNLYSKFRNVQEILVKKKHRSVMEKDFDSHNISFTDSLMLGCYFSVNSPMFFSQLLSRNDYVTEEEKIDAYSLCDYNTCYKNLQAVMNGLKLNEKQRNIFIDAFKSEWQLLDKNESRIGLMLVPRRLYGVDFSIEDFILETEVDDLITAVCKLLDKKNNIVYTNNISKDDITLLCLDGYLKYVKVEKKESLTSELEKTFISNVDDEFAFSNTYGKVSVLVLLGTLLITLGVIITIIKLC